ncbi:response regulator transcription factor [Bacillus sp. PS06]|uniref:response regulator transcription factor n=1 Tax=Bacillus sp. PS06 TaxID=2764176 RepID=UPI001782A42D|nr:response regulator transcription factor [Bacillus sp. PS06]MBD8070521.1 response regulator transcription factor [Bacillus sp. PS06]
MDKQILIIEDEIKIARVLKLELEHEGYKVDMAHTGTSGLSLFQSSKWDLVILDVMLPELSGLELLRRIRGTGDLTPIILLSARDSTPDKVSGLDLGANDYMTKPFEIEELLARIRASLRIKHHSTEDGLKMADLLIEEKSRLVTRSGVNIELTPREYDLLLFLLKNKNQVLNRDQLLTNVWGFDYLGDTNVVDVYIRYLRKKIDQPFSPPLIHTVRGVGYMMKE